MISIRQARKHTLVATGQAAKEYFQSKSIEIKLFSQPNVGNLSPTLSKALGGFMLGLEGNTSMSLANLNFSDKKNTIDKVDFLLPLTSQAFGPIVLKMSVTARRLPDLLPWYLHGNDFISPES